MAGLIGRYLVPPVVIVAAPVIIQFLLNISREEGLEGFSLLMLIGDPFAWLLVSTWLIIASSLLMIPFDKYPGRPSPGHVGSPPEYTDNCGGAIMTATGSFMVFHSIWIHQSLYVYNNFPYVMGAMYIVTMVLSGYLLQRGRDMKNESDDKNDVKVKEPVLYQFCDGIDYHPSLLGFDVKQWAVVRIGLLSWPTLIIAFFYASCLLHGFNWGIFASSLLQAYYVVKASLRETGYIASLDIYGAKPGFYLLWTTMNLVPVLNTFALYYFVAHTPSLNFLSNLGIFLVGSFCITIKFKIEAQKDLFKMTRGNCNIWGHKAKYVEHIVEVKNGQVTRRLLTSGYWGQARHLHYVFEILSAACWSLPGLQFGVWPFLPCIYITVVLIYRLFRDEAKCAAKYGPLWEQYCKTVKYRLIPYIL